VKFVGKEKLLGRVKVGKLPVMKLKLARFLG
jgi:hypothetical protein